MNEEHLRRLARFYGGLVSTICFHFGGVLGSSIAPEPVSLQQPPVLRFSSLKPGEASTTPIEQTDWDTNSYKGRRRLCRCAGGTRRISPHAATRNSPRNGWSHGRRQQQSNARSHAARHRRSRRSLPRETFGLLHLELLVEPQSPISCSKYRRTPGERHCIYWPL